MNIENLSSKDLAYWERNQLVLYLSKNHLSWIENHPSCDLDWEKDWKHIIFIQFPEGLFSWHIHDSELPYFRHLEKREGDSWGGESLVEKYDSLRQSLCDFQVMRMLIGDFPLTENK